jgi:hypothetical protein
MQQERSSIKTQLVRLVPSQQVVAAEQLLYSQTVQCVDLKGGDLLTSYRKLCYERLGELYDEPPENRMAYLQDGITTCEKVWGGHAYEVFRQKEQERREVQVSHSMGMTVQKGTVPCRNCKSLSTVIWFEQTRSGDEGMTSFHQCLECGKISRE